MLKPNFLFLYLLSALSTSLAQISTGIRTGNTGWQPWVDQIEQAMTPDARTWGAFADLRGNLMVTTKTRTFSDLADEQDIRNLLARLDSPDTRQSFTFGKIEPNEYYPFNQEPNYFNGVSRNGRLVAVRTRSLLIVGAAISLLNGRDGTGTEHGVSGAGSAGIYLRQQVRELADQLIEMGY
ncbi:hypothetical protein HDV00_004908 [Rhizophlyctis rosea]|nr:hypothetical protein HDV00_004908 [Rhizophlyctis rosea]